jgi:ADP-ribose pyrophosphatase
MKVISSKELLTTKIFSVVEEVAKDPGGFEIQRAIVRHAGSAVILVADEKERVLLVKQYRLPAQKELWELPAGRLDPGENALQAAKREMKEETGFRAKKWTRLTSFWASPGYVEEKMSIFLATELTEGDQEAMDDERIETKWFTRKELHSAILDGRISDGKTLIGYFFWLEQRKLNRASASR